MENIKASIQFMDNYIKRYELKVDKKIVPEMKIELECSIGFGILNIREEDKLIGEIEMEYKIKLLEEKNEIGKINLTIGAIFEGNKDLTQNKFEQMLKNNGAPIISQVVRSYIMTNTTLSGMPTITMPMINFVEFFNNSENK